MRIALNGFGRIGKTFLRALLNEGWRTNGLELIALNVGPVLPSTLEYSIAYDTILGAYHGDVKYSEGFLYLDGQKIMVVSETDPKRLPWKDLDIDWVIDTSGTVCDAQEALLHCMAGAHHVLVTAPARGVDATIIPGVNTDFFNSQQRVISLGSCTTNALLPLLKIIHQEIGLEFAMATTTHAYTNTQRLLDSDPSKKDLRRSRAAAVNIVPTTMGAIDSVGDVLPELKGRVMGTAMRVPVPIVSLLELTFIAKKSCSKETLNDFFKVASQGNMKGIIDVCAAPLVSSDYIHNEHSVVVDTELTGSCGTLSTVFGWYDNEWGYSCRLKDFLLLAVTK